jgi:hypothetical protein
MSTDTKALVVSLWREAFKPIRGRRKPKGNRK